MPYDMRFLKRNKESVNYNYRRSIERFVTLVEKLSAWRSSTLNFVHFETIIDICF
jgi:hypothetical protein